MCILKGRKGVAASVYLQCFLRHSNVWMLTGSGKWSKNYEIFVYTLCMTPYAIKLCQNVSYQSLVKNTFFFWKLRGGRREVFSKYNAVCQKLSYQTLKTKEFECQCWIPLWFESTHSFCYMSLRCTSGILFISWWDKCCYLGSYTIGHYWWSWKCTVNTFLHLN